MSTQAERATHYNWGWQDGQADRANHRWAVWFKPNAANPIHQHFDGDYARGYHEARLGYRFDNKRKAVADRAARYREVETAH